MLDKNGPAAKRQIETNVTAAKLQSRSSMIAGPIRGEPTSIKATKNNINQEIGNIYKQLAAGIANRLIAEEAFSELGLPRE